MAETCGEVVREKEVWSSSDSNTRAARRKRMEIRRVKFVAGVDSGIKKAKVALSRGSNDAIDNYSYSELRCEYESSKTDDYVNECIPKFGVASVCGRRREMEDCVAIHPSFLDDEDTHMHYFAVYDGHGCSHVCCF